LDFGAKGVAYSPDGKEVAFCDTGGVFQYSTETWELLADFDPHRAHCLPRGVVFDPGATTRLFLMEDQGIFGISEGYHCPIRLSVRGNAIPVSMALLYCEMGPRLLPQTDAS
jgi:hypothetical protein